jgi:hypothetical protein
MSQNESAPGIHGGLPVGLLPIMAMAALATSGGTL